MIRRRIRSADERVLRRTTLRIGLQTAAGVAVTVVTLAAVAVLVVLRSQHAADDDTLAAAITRGDVADPPVGVWVVIERHGRRVMTPDLPRGLPNEADLATVGKTHMPTTSDTVAHGIEYKVDTQPLRGGGVIQAMLDLGADHVERDRLLEALLLSGAAGLVVAAGVALWLSRRMVAPMAGALALQRRFVADAGHELRTPLTLLSTRAQLIRRAVRSDVSADELRSDVDGLVTEAAHLTDILNDLLLAADPRETSAAELVELDMIVTGAVEAAKPSAAERDLAITLRTGPVPPVLGGSASLRRATTALLDNAIRHARSTVAVTLSTAGGHVLVDVTDDGPGIDPAVLPNLFDRFATARTDVGRGPRRYGLGLALVSEIASRHGGSIVVCATSGDGAMFRLSIPAARRNTRG